MADPSLPQPRQLAGQQRSGRTPPPARWLHEQEPRRRQVHVPDRRRRPTRSAPGHPPQPDRVLADLSASARPDRDYDAENTALIHFAYDSGLYGSLLVSRFIGPKREQIRLVGSKGIVQLERGRIQRLANDGEIVESLSREQAWPSAAACQVDHFCKVIGGLRPNASGPGEHLAHMSFIAAAYESARTHAYVSPRELLP